MPQPYQNWVTVGTIIGVIIFGAVLAFQKLYGMARGEERARVERAPEIIGNAVGAAFVDRTAASAIIAMAESVKHIGSDVDAMLELMREKAGQDHDDRIAHQAAELAEKRLLEKLKRGGAPTA